MNLRTPTTLFLVGVVLLTALSVTSLTVLGEGSRTGFDYGGFYANDDRAVWAKSVVMREGDRLVFRPELSGAPYPIFDRYDFYIVKGGDRFALLDGNETTPVYHRVLNISAASCCPHGYRTFDRPADESYRREGRSPIETGPGIDVDMRKLELSVLDQPERIDVVWVLHYRAGVEYPANASERRLFNARAEAELIDAPSLTVLRASAIRAQPALYAGMIGAALLAAVAGVLWLARFRSADPPAEAGRSEALVAAYEAAGTHLKAMRDLLLAGFVVALLVAMHVGLFVLSDTMSALYARGEIVPTLRWIFFVAMIVLYSAVVVSWLATALFLHRAYRRWQARMRALPEV